jgi:hypothetical protein
MVEFHENKKNVFIELKFKLLKNLLEHCELNPTTGTFYCAKCESTVAIDWYRNFAFCSMHIFSPFGVTYIPDMLSYKINFKKNYEEVNKNEQKNIV